MFYLNSLLSGILFGFGFALGGREDNSIMAILFKLIPYQVALPLKGVVATVMAFYVGTYNIYAEIAMVLLYSWVVIHNYRQIRG